MREVFGAMERNNHAVISMFSPLVNPGETVVEFGSGPGAHAALFCKRRPDVSWIPTDLGDRFDSVAAWSDYLETTNVESPVVVDLLNVSDVPRGQVGFCMNTIHVAPPEAVDGVFRAAAASGVRAFFLYGPFRFAGIPLEPSNQTFNTWLKGRFEGGGIRVFEEVNETARSYGFALQGRAGMPSNNHAFWWRATQSAT